MLGAAERVGTETVPTSEATGRILATDLRARFAVPPFTNSAMDGYAVRAADLVEPRTLPVAGDAPAGAAPVRLEPGTALRIMTGAPLPEGADAVVPVEQTDQRPGPGEVPSEVSFSVAARAGANVRHRGEDVAEGDLVMRAGERVSAAAIGALLSVGHAQLEVTRRLRVAVMATGDELASGGEALAPGSIPDSNGPMLAALVTGWGADAVLLPASRDSVAEFLAALEGAGDVDLVITTGGVSAGAFEVVRQALAGRGVEFVGVAMQPGKPQGFGAIELGRRRVLVACLPGNPVSVFVSFHVLVRPLLGRMSGLGEQLRALRAIAGHDWMPPRGRTQYAPAVVTQEDGRLVVRLPHELGAKSHLIASLHLANVLVMVPADVDAVAAGDELEVLPVEGFAAG